MITVENLTKTYGNFEAVKGISFEVKEGEIFGLLGPNGAGKSTTLEIMETLRSKTSGKITIAGFDLDEHPMRSNASLAFSCKHRASILDSDWWN